MEKKKKFKQLTEPSTVESSNVFIHQEAFADFGESGVWFSRRGSTSLRTVE